MRIRWKAEAYRLCDKNVEFQRHGYNYLAYYSAFEGGYGAVIQYLTDGKVLERCLCKTLADAKRFCRNAERRHRGTA